MQLKRYVILDASLRCSSSNPTMRPRLTERMRCIAFLSILFVISISPFHVQSLFAQITTAEVLGTVTDTSGAVIPGATVTLVDLDTQGIHTTLSNGSGDFTFTLLQPNHYSLTVSIKGFKTSMIHNIFLSAGDVVRENTSLSIGSSVQTVEVQGQQPALQTDSSVVSHLITNAGVQDLPLNGRNFINLVQVSPGVTEGTNNGLASGNRPDDRRQTSSISVNGQSDVNNNEMIDGLDNNERMIGSIGVAPSVDAIQEVRIQTNDFTVDAGRAAGAVVNVITKSGTNNLHGTAYEFFRNAVLNANPYDFGQTLPKPSYNQNQFGGSLGGPIRKNKTFFFGDYEGLRIARRLNPTQTTVPTAFERANPGNFTDNPAINKIIPPSDFDPVGVLYFNLFPAPTNSALSNNYTVTPSETQFSTTWDGKIDHRFNGSNSMFGRYTYNGVTTTFGGLFPAVKEAGVTVQPGGNRGTYPGPAKDNAQQAMLDYLHIFSPNLVMDLKAGYTYLNNTQYSLNYGKNISSAFGLPNSDIPGWSGLAPVAFSLEGNNLGDNTLLSYVENTFQYLGNMTWTHGRHNFNFGAGYMRRQDTVVNLDTGLGSWLMNDFSGLLSGTFLSISRSNILVVPHFRSREYHMYAEDNWNPTKSLALNYGVRWDVYTPFTEINNHLSQFDIELGRIVVAGTPGVSDYANIRPDYKDVAPRVGFALTVTPQTVLRGGFGLSFTPENMTSGAMIVNQPFLASFGPCIPAICPAAYQKLSDGVPLPTATSATNPSGSISANENPNFKASYVQQFNLTLEREFSGNTATISYIGTLGRRLAYYLPDFNKPAPNSESYVDPTATNLVVSSFNYNTLRPFYHDVPNVTTFPLWTSSGASSYNALQAVLQRRLKNGLDFQVNYTWAHGLDDSETISQDGQDGFGSVPSEVSTLEYGNSNLDVRHRIALTADYVLPFGANLSGIKGFLAKGWQMNGVYVWSTGYPFSITNNLNRSGTEPGAGNDDRPNQVVANPNLSHPSVKEWFNTSAFVGQTGGLIGTERRNQVYGPHYQHLDLSLFKLFPITHRATLEFRTEAFNVANTTAFANPSASLGGAGYGVISSTKNEYNPRLIQFAAKIIF